MGFQLRVCEQGHEGCWIHPARPGYEGGRINASPDGWGDDREVTTNRTERLRALYAAMDEAATRWHGAFGAPDQIEAGDAMASIWSDIRTELGL